MDLTIAYRILGLNEGVIDGDNMNVVMLDPVAHMGIVSRLSCLISGHQRGNQRIAEDLGASEGDLLEHKRALLTIRPIRPKPLIPT